MKRFLWLLIGLLLIASASHAQMIMMNVENSRGGPTYTGPGNVVSGAAAWWGLRAYNTAYAVSLGKIANVCISTGNTGPDTTCGDVSSDSSGNFNIAASTVSACSNTGANQCTVKILYDQSGASSCTGPCDLSNTTIANRPILVVPGAANGCTTTSHFCMSTPTTLGAQSLVNATGFSSGSAQPFTVTVAFNNTVRNGDEYLFDSTNFGVPILISGFSGAAIFAINNGANATVTGVSDNAYHSIQTIFCCTGNSGASSDINVDGSTNPVSAGSATLGTINPVIFNATGPTGGTNGFSGFTLEWGVWKLGFTNTPVTGQAALMSNNVHGYWGF